MGGPTAERVYTRRLYTVALSVGARNMLRGQTRREMTGDKSRTPIFPHPTGSLLMICIDGNWRAAAAALLLATGGSAMAGSLGGPMELQDEGSFFVNGQLTQSTHPGTAVGGISQPGTITVNQMYVQYRIPKTVSGPAIV